MARKDRWHLAGSTWLRHNDRVQSPSTDVPSERHVLIVEDDPDIRSLLELALERDGWIVECVTDGAAALRSLQDHLPNVVLLDLAMPQMDGWAVLARRAVEQAWLRVPVVAMSANHSHGPAVVELGANAFLPKPFTVEQLRATLEQHSARP
jgi:CheY-like chemotaxis protein